MSKASELMERVLARMEERDLPVWYINGCHKRTEEEKESGTWLNPIKTLDVEETYRHNGTEENVTVKIECVRWGSNNCGRREICIKVPKNASDKVIDKRLDEVEKWLNG